MGLSYAQRVERAKQLPTLTAAALAELSAGGQPVPLAALADHLGLCRPTVSNILERLAQRRAPHPRRRAGGWVWIEPESP